VKQIIAAILGCALGVTVSAQDVRQNTVTEANGSKVTITDLGLLPGGTASSGLAINDEPTVVGLATDNNLDLQRPFWDANTGAIIGFADNFDPASTAVPEHLNNNREMAGTEVISSGRLFRGVYWNPTGQAFGLPPLAGIDPSFGQVHIMAHGINNLGQIVGSSQDESFTSHTVLWQNKDTAPLDLGVIGDSYGVNDLSHVVGNIFGSPVHGFLWRNGSVVQLSALNGQVTSEAYAINNNGLIAGKSNFFPATWQYDPANGGSTPVIQQLPIPAGFFAATPRAVNDPGDVAGYAGSPNIDSHAILWRNGLAIDLGIWPGGHYSVANKINNLGQIVGTGTVAGDNLDHALMWTVDDGTPNTTPSPAMTARPNKIRVGGSVSVRASFTDPDNGPWNYTVDWGDGKSATGTVSVPGKINGISPHIYTQSGTFSATLAVTDALGANGVSSPSTIRVR
jgi:probable HAF family extracellular repeat protein